MINDYLNFDKTPITQKEYSMALYKLPLGAHAGLISGIVLKHRKRQLRTKNKA